MSQRRIWLGAPRGIFMSVILPGCLRWRGEEARVSSVCCRLRSCSSPHRPDPCSGFDQGLPGLSLCLCDSLGAGLRSPGSLWALGCAWAPGIPGSPSHRHSPPCIYYKYWERRVATERREIKILKFEFAKTVKVQSTSLLLITHQLP